MKADWASIVRRRKKMKISTSWDMGIINISRSFKDLKGNVLFIMYFFLWNTSYLVLLMTFSKFRSMVTYPLLEKM